MKHLSKHLLLVVIVLFAIKSVAQNHCHEMNIDAVKTEIMQDSLIQGSINLEEKYDISVFYIGNCTCVVHIFQYCSGVMD